MGSPDTENERSDDEQRHRVTLTGGFWMADTACTQALYEAVLGETPSRFTGVLNRPVEMVSWDDIHQSFLPALNNLLPGLNAVLPTEAQWEFACRAGTETPFHYGEQITPKLVNYDGNVPYRGVAKGEYREATVPVKSLPPNDWGLYEMHGNVLEWCNDGYGPYGADEKVDPAGDLPAASRVLRGGSWFHFAWYCRSAYRKPSTPGYRDSNLGFRVCCTSAIE